MAEGDEDLQEKSLLKSMGVEDYEPRVIHQFLELWYRYVVDVLTDALVYSEHAGKPAIDCDDVKLAIQSKVNSSFSQPPPREVLLELARNRNKAPLPKSIARPGIPLPPEQDTLIKPNYQLAISNLPKQLKKWGRMKKVVLILTHHKNRRQICHNILLKEWPSPSQNVPSESFMIERADGSIGFK